MKTAMRAPMGGIVTKVRYSDITEEITVTIDGKYIELKMYHIQEVIVHPGDQVLQGDIIGYSNQEEVMP